MDTLPHYLQAVLNRALAPVLCALVLCVPVPALSAPFAGVLVQDEPALSREDLLGTYRQFLGKQIDDALVDDILSGFTALYRQRDYLQPAPRLVRTFPDTGFLVIEMREAHVARVSVSGREHVQQDEFWAHVETLKQTRPLSRKAFDQWLVDASALGVAAQGDLIRAGENAHRYLASVKVQANRLHGLIHTDNRAPPQLGHELAQVMVGYRFRDERAGYLRLDLASAWKTDRLKYGGLSGTHRLRRRGDSLRWKYAYSESLLPLAGLSSDIAYERERIELKYEMPIKKHLRNRSDLSLELRHYGLRQALESGFELRDDILRTSALGYARVDVDKKGRIHRFKAQLERSLQTRFETFNDVSGADESFTVLSLEYRVQQRFKEVWKLHGRLELQASAQRLPGSKRFSIGGGQLGGAYDPATLSADEGLGIRLGLDRTFKVNGLDAPLLGYVYYDHGYVQSNSSGFESDHAGSAGIGVRIPVRTLSVSLELAQPVVKPRTPDLLNEDTRLFFTLTQRF